MGNASDGSNCRPEGAHPTLCCRRFTSKSLGVSVKVTVHIAAQRNKRINQNRQNKTVTDDKTKQ